MIKPIMQLEEIFSLLNNPAITPAEKYAISIFAMYLVRKLMTLKEWPWPGSIKGLVHFSIPYERSKHGISFGSSRAAS